MRRTRLPLGLIAAAALLGSHWLAYLLASPDPHDRAHLLQATGHGYWPVAGWVAVAIAIAGVGSFISGRMSPATLESRAAIFRHTLPRFLVLQIGGFVVLELGERLLAGNPIGVATLLESTLLIGLVVQAIAAIAAALLLVAIAFAVDRFISRTARPSIVGSRSLPLESLISPPRLLPATGAYSLRGPPALS